MHDLIVVGAGPTGIAVGAEAVGAGLDVLLVERGGVCEAIRNYPTDLEFFTTRERLEIAGVPFTIPDPKPSRRQALAYYREVVRLYDPPMLLRHEVREIAVLDGDESSESTESGFELTASGRRGAVDLRSRAVVLATGYFGRPKRLGVPGEELPWVRSRYREPYEHLGERVMVVGGGNSAVKTALELFRWGVDTIVVHRGESVKEGVKYWLRPDFENRVSEGSIAARFESRVRAFEPGAAIVETPSGTVEEPIDAVYVLIGYEPELDLAAQVGVEIDAETLVPAYDPETCESNVTGFYIAGTLQAGRFTDRIFIENSRHHAPRIVGHLRRGLRTEDPSRAAASHSV